MNCDTLRSLPLGAVYDSARKGTQFTVYAGARATAVKLCLFAAIEDTQASKSIELQPITEPGTYGCPGRFWSVFVENVSAGQLYGYRVDGPWDPNNGARYNVHKLLLDPWAKALGRNLRWHAALFAYDRSRGSNGDADLFMSTEDSAPFAPLAMVVGPSDFDWRGDSPPEIPWTKTVLYECHVKGQTALHPRVDRQVRGTYLGLVHPEHLTHLRRLGVTSVELMPTHQAPPAGIPYLNYWKYDALGYLIPNRDYSLFRRAQDCNDEVKEMVRLLHAGGFEAILDVVFNHTGEGDEFGPTLSLRGFANEDIYRLCGKGDGPYRGYMNFSGCGNTLNVASPIVRRLIIDAIKWWMSEYHIAGKRFDLAGILHYGLHGFDSDSDFMKELEAELEGLQLKRVAEPWDVAGHHLGRFKKPWREWNDRYRDDMRRFVRGDPGFLAAFANRFLGSRNDFPEETRGQCVSINFITCHDGFTLHDLVTYLFKRNEANGEGNRDGTNENYSANYGEDGETDNPEINRVRRRQQRNFVTFLALSNGVPMILGGDELDRTQRGNNNGYVLDDAATWNPWGEGTHWLTEFYSGAFALRSRFPAFQWADTVRWLTPGGSEMESSHWEEAERRSLLIELSSHDQRESCTRKLIVAVNMHWSDAAELSLPGGNDRWVQLLDTDITDNWFQEREVEESATIRPRSVRVFVEKRG